MFIVPAKRLEIKQRLVKNCAECAGQGCQVCLNQLIVVDRLAEANIPINYWFFKMKDYKGEEVKKEIISYIDSLSEKLSTGEGLCFAGTYGTGKTTGLCAILKNAILRNYEVYYTTLNDLVMYSMDYDTKQDYMFLTQRAQFLAIDEVDGRHFSTSEEAQKVVGSNFEKLIRTRIQNCLPTLVATNHASLEEAFSGQYKRVVESLMLTRMKTISVLGKDQRKAKDVVTSK